MRFVTCVACIDWVVLRNIVKTIFTQCFPLRYMPYWCSSGTHTVIWLMFICFLRFIFICRRPAFFVWISTDSMVFVEHDFPSVTHTNTKFLLYVFFLLFISSHKHFRGKNQNSMYRTHAHTNSDVVHGLGELQQKIERGKHL